MFRSGPDPMAGHGCLAYLAVLIPFLLFLALIAMVTYLVWW